MDSIPQGFVFCAKHKTLFSFLPTPSSPRETFLSVVYQLSV